MTIVNSKEGTSPAPHQETVKTGSLGTFAGVFTPSILTILGIILFLRLGYVVGNAGFGRTLIIIGLANAISVLTSVSLAAIATNLRVKGGGDYYLISRTLGVEFGGAIGLVLFLAQSISIAFYCIGFGEALGGILPDVPFLSSRLIATLAVLFLFVFAWLGADWATRFQYVVMTVMAMAILSFFIGGVSHWRSDLLVQNWQAPGSTTGFWVIFAIFFPAVTGFTQGISMSGDLKDPSKSLPTGTFLAVGLSILVYFGVAIVFAGVLPNPVMAEKYDSMKQVAQWGFLIDAGVIAATLSSAMASFLGAPRILQSLAGDRIFKFLMPFAKGYGPTQNPRRGVLLSGGIAIITVLLGKLNLIAPLVSMFFLISYGLLNYATFYEAQAASPAFRPRFRWFDKRLSFLGFLTCLGVMLAIDPKTGVVAIAILVAIYHYLKRTAGPARWADSTRAFHLQKIRENLLAAMEDPRHPRDWRPMILALTNDRERRPFLFSFANWIEGGSGLTGAVRFIEGEGASLKKKKEAAEKELLADIHAQRFKIFPMVIGAPDILEAFPVAFQSYGIGPLKANMLLINWFGQTGAGIPGLPAMQYVDTLKSAFRLGLNLVILKTDSEQWRRMAAVPPEKRRIDILWRGDATSRLMLLLAYLMRRNDFWEQADIRVIAAIGGADPDAEKAALKEEMEYLRIEARVAISERLDLETIATKSADASILFMPFRILNHRVRSHTDETFERALPRLPATALVLASEEIDLDAAPEEGLAADLAAAADILSESEKRAVKTEQEAQKAREKASEIMTRLQTAEKLPGLSDADFSKLHAEAIHAIAVSEKAFRKAMKARARAVQAAKAASDLGLKPTETKTDSEGKK